MNKNESQIMKLMTILTDGKHSCEQKVSAIMWYKDIGVIDQATAEKLAIKFL